MTCKQWLLRGVVGALTVFEKQPLSHPTPSSRFAVPARFNRLVHQPTALPASNNIIQYPSKNWNSRRGQRIVFLIEHYTAENKEAALKRLTDPAAQVSSHYLVDEEGTIYQLVAEENRAWHAGLGFWDGYTDINSVSIGIEIVNPGNAPYTQAQMASVQALSLDIAQRHAIPPTQILGHSDVAVTARNHKSDPGWFFDWRNLAAQGIGVFPQPTGLDYSHATGWSNDEFKRNLTKYGYTADTTFAVLVEAFQRHFQQEVAQAPTRIGVADVETKARLSFLLRFKDQHQAGLRRHSRWWPRLIRRIEKLNNKVQSR